MVRPSKLNFSKTITINIEAEQYAFIKEKDIPISLFFRTLIEEYKDKGYMVKEQREAQKEIKELKNRILELEDEIEKIKPRKKREVFW